MKEMTLSEAVSLAKQEENKVYKLTQVRKSIVNEGFDEVEYLGRKEEFSAEEYNEKRKEFLKQKKEKMDEVQSDITDSIEKVITLRNTINKKNIEIGQDMNLIRMKWLRVQLDNLMKEVGYNQGRLSSYHSVDSDNYESLGIGERINELEKEKNELDNKIQKLNHTTKISVDL